MTPTWRRNVTREPKKHFFRIPLPPFGGKMSPRGAPREPKWGPNGAKGPQNGTQESPKWIKKGSRSETQNREKVCECRSKIDFRRPVGGTKGANKNTTKGIEKSKRGSRGKVGVHRLQDGPRIAKRNASEGYGTFWQETPRAQGPAVGGRGDYQRAKVLRV